MTAEGLPALDLMPPPFSEGLYDWSRTDGTPDSPTYGESAICDVRIARNDGEFGTCLELRKTDTIQRLRYMGEMPFRPGSYLEVGVRIKMLRGPRALARIAAWPGGRGGRLGPYLEMSGRVAGLDVYDRAYEICTVIGPEPLPGVDIVWSGKVLYAHVGLDLIGPKGGVVRIEDMRVNEVTEAVTGTPRIMPGFTAADLRVVSGGRR